MSTLTEYLAQKKAALRTKQAEAAANADPQPTRISASVRAAGRSGIRQIRIRDFQVLSDSGPDFAGYNLGPSSPELQLGVLGSCLTHIFLIQAADRDVPIDSIDVEIAAELDPQRAGKPGFEHVPIYPHNISYVVRVTSPASRAQIDALHEAVEANCPILNLLLNPQTISGKIELSAQAAAAPAAYPTVAAVA